MAQGSGDVAKRNQAKIKLYRPRAGAQVRYAVTGVVGHLRAVETGAWRVSRVPGGWCEP